MARTSGQKRRRRTLQILLVPILLALLIGIIFAEGQRISSAVSRETVVSQSYRVSDSYEAYYFRREEALISSKNGPVNYLVPDGSLVSGGTEIAHVFDDMGDGARQEVRVLYEQICALKEILAVSEQDWQVDYLDAYTSTMAALTAADLTGGTAAADRLIIALQRGSVTGESEGAAVNRAALEQTLALLVATMEEKLGVGDDFGTVSNAGDGIFFDEADGYEIEFDPAKIEGLTPEGLDLLAATRPTDKAIGKIVLGSSIYFAVQLTASEAALYREAGEYLVSLDGKTSASMTLERITLSDDGSRALLILHCTSLPQELVLTRRLTLKIERAVYTGLSLPLSALYTEGDQTFVFVDEQGTASRRRVEILYREAGVCLAYLREEEGYLQPGESLLITARRIYEGKAIR